MNSVGEVELRTQQRVIAFFRDALGYQYLGNWLDRPDNSNVEPEILRGWLQRRGLGDRTIGRALDRLGKAADPGGSKTL